jgi:hypothetical protein
MKLDKEDSLLAMRILLIKNKKNDVLDEYQFLEDVYTLLINQDCNGCKYDYKIYNFDKDIGLRLDDLSPQECCMCSRNHHDKFEKK